MVSIFPNLCLWRRSLRSNVGGIDPEKLYRATLMLFFFLQEMEAFLSTGVASSQQKESKIEELKGVT